MNKKNLLNVYLLVGALSVSGAAWAQEDEAPCYLEATTAKVTQGFFNTTTGFIEIPKNIINIGSDRNVLLGLSWGLLRGTAHAVSRTLVGVAELITAPIPTDDYITPPYVWERFSEDTRYFGLHYPGFWTTYGPLDDGD